MPMTMTCWALACSSCPLTRPTGNAIQQDRVRMGRQRGVHRGVEGSADVELPVRDVEVDPHGRAAAAA